MTTTQRTGIRRELEAAPNGAAGANLRQAVEWHSINWRQAKGNVRRLQRRIVQAQQQGKAEGFSCCTASSEEGV